MDLMHAVGICFEFFLLAVPRQAAFSVLKTNKPQFASLAARATGEKITKAVQMSVTYLDFGYCNVALVSDWKSNIIMNVSYKVISLPIIFVSFFL